MSEHPGGHRAVVGPWSSCVASRQLGLHLKAGAAAHRVLEMLLPQLLSTGCGSSSFKMVRILGDEAF